MTAVSKRNRIRYNRAEARAAWLLLLPSVIGLTCITYLPMIASFALSLFNWNGLGDMKFVGFENYANLFSGKGSASKRYMASLTNLLIYVPITVAVGLFIAVMLRIYCRIIIRMIATTQLWRFGKMKRILAVLLALMMLAACAAAETADFSGEET